MATARVEQEIPMGGSPRGSANIQVAHLVAVGELVVLLKYVDLSQQLLSWTAGAQVLRYEGTPRWRARATYRVIQDPLWVHPRCLIVLEKSIQLSSSASTDLPTIARTLFPGQAGYLLVAEHQGQTFKSQYLSLASATWTQDLLQQVQQSPANLYWGVGVRGTTDQREIAVAHIHFLWADLDAHDFPGGLEEATKRLESYVFTPSLVLHSGHGLHAYWLLNEPVRIADASVRADVRSRVRQLAQSVGGDHTFDLSRVLRIPLSTNWKDPQNPIPTRVLVWEPTRRYALEMFPAGDAVGNRATVEALPVAFEPSAPVDLTTLPEWLQDKVAEAVPAGGRSEHDYAVIGALLEGGLTPGQIQSVFTTAPCGARYRQELARGNGETYLGTAIRKLQAAVRDPGDPDDGHNRAQVLDWLGNLDELARERALKRVAKVWQVPVKTLRTEVQQTAEANRAPGLPVLEQDATAPVDEAVTYPPGIQATPEGLGTGRQILFPARVLVLHVVTDMGGMGREHVAIAWNRGRGWELAVVPRRTIADKQMLLELTDRGLPVTTQNAPWLVGYLAAFEAHNRGHLRFDHGTTTLGWKDTDAGTTFLCGDTAVGPAMALHPTSNGAQQLMGALHPQGSWEAWRALWDTVTPFPLVRFAIYAAAAAPLLRIIHADNFVVDYAGRTSGGKSTSIRLAASVWGNPAKNGGFFRGWDTTQVGIEQILEFAQDMPTFLDESHLAKNADLLSQVIYEVANGMGRTRGAASGGNQALATWRTVLLSSGEQRLVDSGSHGGIQARVVTLWGSPFGPNQEQVVKGVERGMRQHYGHAGPDFVRWLLHHQGAWEGWARAFERLEGQLMGRAPGNPVAQRIAGACATVGLAGVLFHHALGLAEPQSAWEATVAVFESQLTLGQESTAERAWRIVLDTVAEEAQLEGVVRSHAGVWGIWYPWNPELPAGTAAPEVLFLLRTQVERILQAHNISASVLLEWRDLGWLVAEPHRLTTKLPDAVSLQLHQSRALKVVLAALPAALRPSDLPTTIF